MKGAPNLNGIVDWDLDKTNFFNSPELLDEFEK